LKHGPIALIDKDMPILGLTPKDAVYKKSISNVEEIKARQGRLILIGTEGDEHLKSITDDVFIYLKFMKSLTPFCIPFQLSYSPMRSHPGEGVMLISRET